MKNKGERAVKIKPYLSRLTQTWGFPSYLTGEQWRLVVRQQPIAEVCRDTLIANLLSLEWDIVPEESDDDETDDAIRKKTDIQHHKDLFQELEGDFDIYIELICQDMLDLPFGAMSELGRENDDPDGRLLWVNHVDGATLAPTNVPEFPVIQTVPGVPTQTVVFPKHSIDRMFMTPRPEIRLKGWGMSPPQKIYLAILMLFRGDTYYAGLLLDTPEAGILDLMDMSEQSANEWLEGFRTLFSGIDGMKIPVLYEHEIPAKFISFGRPPQELLLDKTTHKYAQIVAAGYGLRLSDIGMAEQSGEKTLAGVIRGERQTKRNGVATIRTKTANHFNRLLKGTGLKFIWIESDSEDTMMRSRGLLTSAQALGTAVDKQFISRLEGRKQLIADGHLTIDLDPDELPEQEEDEGNQQESNPFDELAKQGNEENAENQKVPATQGGRGDVTGTIKRTIARIMPKRRGTSATPIPVTHPELINELGNLVNAQLAQITENAGDTQLTRLIRAATKQMFPNVQRIFPSMSNENIQLSWLSQMNDVTDGNYHQTNFEEEGLAVLRAHNDEIRQQLDNLLAKESWWQTSSEATKAEIIRVFRRAFEHGLYDSALSIARALYESGLRDTPQLLGISFSLSNPVTLSILDNSAALLVRRIDEGTRYYIKNAIISGVRTGLASPDIAEAIRSGAALEDILGDADFVGTSIARTRNALAKISSSRAISIVNTEINKAENEARLEQYKRSSLTQKLWRHLGKRGQTDAGNEHPCPVCTLNEAAGVVPINFEYQTVFKNETIQHPPGHPGVCHCIIHFAEKDLFKIVGSGEFVPWTGD